MAEEDMAEGDLAKGDMAEWINFFTPLTLLNPAASF